MSSLLVLLALGSAAHRECHDTPDELMPTVPKKKAKSTAKGKQAAVEVEEGNDLSRATCNDESGGETSSEEESEDEQAVDDSDIDICLQHIMEGRRTRSGRRQTAPGKLRC